MTSVRKYNELKSKEGVRIEISYVPETTQANGFEFWKATGVSFSIENSTDTGLWNDSRVTLVLINRNSEQSQQVYQVQMGNPSTSEGLTSFSGDIMGTVPVFEVSEDGTPTSYSPQVALVIDGVWQIDPVQPGEQHNFNFAWLIPETA